MSAIKPEDGILAVPISNEEAIEILKNDNPYKCTNCGKPHLVTHSTTSADFIYSSSEQWIEFLSRKDGARRNASCFATFLYDDEGRKHPIRLQLFNYVF